MIDSTPIPAVQFAITPSTQPPPGYMCYRCMKPGHFIRFCPTNGDPAFDFRRAKPATGIPREFLRAGIYIFFDIYS